MANKDETKDVKNDEYSDKNVAERQRESAESAPQEDQDLATEMRNEAARNHAAEHQNDKDEDDEVA